MILRWDRRRRGERLEKDRVPGRVWASLVLALSCMGWAAAGGGPRLVSPPQGFAADPYCKVRELLEDDPPRRQICYSYPGGEAGDRVVISEFSEAVGDRRAEKILKKMISRRTRSGLESSVSFTGPRRMEIDGEGCWTSLGSIKDGRGSVERLELIAIVPSAREDVTYLVRFDGVSPRFRNEAYMRRVVASFRTRAPISMTLLQLGGAALVLLGVIWLLARGRGEHAAPAPRRRPTPGHQMGRAPRGADPGAGVGQRIPGDSWEEWMGAAGPRSREKSPPAAIPLSSISTFQPPRPGLEGRGALWSGVAGPEVGSDGGSCGGRGDSDEVSVPAPLGANPEFEEISGAEEADGAMEAGSIEEMFEGMGAGREGPAPGPAEAGASTRPPPLGADQRALTTREVFPGSTGHGKLDRLWEAFGRRPLEALDQMQTLWRGDPDDPRLGHALVLMRAKARQVDQAIELARLVIPRCLETGELELGAEIFAALLQQAGGLGLDARQLVTLGFALEQRRDTARAAHAFARALRLDPGAEPAAEGLLRVADRLMVDEASRDQARGIYQYVINHGEAASLVERARQRLDQSYVSAPDPLLH